MKILSGPQAMANLKQSIRDNTVRIPHKADAQYDGFGFIPNFKPKFKISKESSFFTMGSCFAREIEHRLQSSDYRLYVNEFNPQIQSFMIGEDGNTFPDSHLLNEYNLGTMCQRVLSASGEFSYHEDSGLLDAPDGKFKDLYLHTLSFPHEKQSLLARRKIIDEYYKNILLADVVVITLGLIESWYDTKFKSFLNKAPHSRQIALEPKRFQFMQFDAKSAAEYLDMMIRALNVFDKKILITVSPVPLEATFSGNHCLMASTYAKSVLRTAAELMRDKYANVDYFPSYEIVMSRGMMHGFIHDNTHVNHQAIDAVFSTLHKNFLE